MYQMMWQSKHGITDAAMRDWKAITLITLITLMTPYIDHSELKSGQMCRLYRSYFPLMPLFPLDVSQEVTGDMIQCQQRVFAINPAMAILLGDITIYSPHSQIVLRRSGL